MTRDPNSLNHKIEPTRGDVAKGALRHPAMPILSLQPSVLHVNYHSSCSLPYPFSAPELLAGTMVVETIMSTVLYGPAVTAPEHIHHVPHSAHAPHCLHDCQRRNRQLRHVPRLEPCGGRCAADIACAAASCWIEGLTKMCQ